MDEAQLQALGFNWDQGNLYHCQKHGVSIEEVEGLFRSTFFLIKDTKHSNQETRMIAVGIPPHTQKPLFVAFTLRKQDTSTQIRPISARYMHQKEVRKYEQAITDL